MPSDFHNPRTLAELRKALADLARQDNSTQADLDALEAVAVTAAMEFGTDDVLLASDGTERGAKSTGIDKDNVVTAVANFTSGELVRAAGSDKTTDSSGVLAANVVTASANFAGANFLILSAGANKAVNDSTISESDLTTAFSNIAAIQADYVSAASPFGTDDVLLASDGTSRGAKSTGIDKDNVVQATSNFSADNQIIRADGTAKSVQSGAWVISDTGLLGAGTTTPGSIIDIVGTDGTTSTVQVTRYSDDTSPPQINFRKARGSVSTPAAVQSGDTLGVFPCSAYRNGAFSGLLGPAPGYFEFRVTGTVSGNSVPTSVVFHLIRSGDTVNSDAVTFWHQRSLIIGSPSHIPGAGDEGLFVMARRNDTDPSSIVAGTAGLKVKNVSSSAEMFAWNAAGEIKQISGFKTNLGSATELTIAAGVVTCTRSFHTIDTQSDDASDDLDTINGGAHGDILVLHAANSARTVVVKDGTGNIRCAGDFSLDNAEDTIMLIHDGSNWLEISRSDNGA